MWIRKPQAAADVAAKIVAKVFRSVTDIEKGWIIPKIVVDFLPVRYGIITFQVVKKEIQAG